MEIKELVQDTIAQMERLSKTKLEIDASSANDEKEFLQMIRDRLNIFFIGLQSEGVVNVEEKLDMTVEFLSFLKDKTDERLKKLV